jgi:hypothetical protein
MFNPGLESQARYLKKLLIEVLFTKKYKSDKITADLTNIRLLFLKSANNRINNRKILETSRKVSELRTI